MRWTLRLSWPLAAACLACAAWPASAAMVSAPAALTQLNGLPPLQQIERLQELASEGPSGRNLAAVFVKPGLAVLRRQELQAQLDEYEIANLINLAAALHIEARADERVMAGLEALTQQISPDGRVGLLDLASWYDGAAPENAPPAVETPAPAPGKLSPVLAWPAADAVDAKGRVRTMTSRDDQLLINGKRAQPFHAPRTDGEVVHETYIHPSDPEVLVKIYHSATSLGGFELKHGRVESLTPLSAAGAAPKLIEHGEAAVEGKGRVYFYAQELVQGARLGDLPPAQRPLDAVRQLFERLIKAGLALVVPGPDQDWLLSHIMVGKTASGGMGAYVLNGGVEPASPDELKAHYDMLLSVLDPGPLPEETQEPRPQPELTQTPALRAQPAFQRLAALPEASDPRSLAVSAVRPELLEPLLKRHQLDATRLSSTASVPGPKDPGLDAAAAQAEGAASRPVLLPSEHAAAEAAAALLADPEVFQVKVHPSVKGYVEKRGAKELYAILRLMPESRGRDALIAKIPGPAYAKTESSEIVAILSLASKEASRYEGDAEPANALYKGVPEQAWQRLERRDAQRLVKQWTALGQYNAASAAIERWVRAHADATGKEILEWLTLLPGSAQRDSLILGVPIQALARMESAQIATLLGLANFTGPASEGYAETASAVHQGLAEQAWRRLNREDAQSLVKQWTQRGQSRTAATVVERWVRAHDADQAGEPKARWQGLQDWLKLLPDSQRSEIITPLWPLINKDAAGPEIVERLAMLPPLAQRDELIAGLPGETFAKIESADVLAILQAVSYNSYEDRTPLFKKIPAQAWKALSRADAEKLVDTWSNLNGGTAAAIASLWLASRLAAALQHDASGADLYAMLKRIPESVERDELILAIPARTYSTMSGSDVAGLLSLVSATGEKEQGAVYNRVPAEAWARLSLLQEESIIKRWTAVSYSGTASVARRLWIAVRSETPSGRATEDGWTGLYDSLSALPESESRDQWILEIPAGVYARLGSRDSASILALVSRTGEQKEGAVYHRIPVEAWDSIRLKDKERLVARWNAVQYNGTAGVVEKLWQARQKKAVEGGSRGADLYEMIKLLPESDHRDGLVLKISDGDYGKMASGDIARLLSLVGKAGEGEKATAVYRKIPGNAWYRMERQDMEGLIKKWTDKDQATAAAIVELWMSAQQ